MTSPTPILEHEIPGGAAWSLQLRRGRVVTLTAGTGHANASMLAFAAGDPLDRMNIPDTLKAQMSARIRPPMVLMSDRGVGLASVTGSSLDWHDAITGHSTDRHLEQIEQSQRLAPTSYHADRNAWRHSARTGFISELSKHGRGRPDLHACVNWFSKVATSSDDLGPLTFVPGHAQAGDWVRLRSEVDLLLVFSTAPHPLATVWDPASIGVAVTPGEPYGADDPSVTFRGESARALAAAKAVFA